MKQALLIVTVSVAVLCLASGALASELSASAPEAGLEALEPEGAPPVCLEPIPAPEYQDDIYWCLETHPHDCWYCCNDWYDQCMAGCDFAAQCRMECSTQYDWCVWNFCGY